jgi:membrane-associated protein
LGEWYSGPIRVGAKYYRGMDRSIDRAVAGFSAIVRHVSAPLLRRDRWTDGIEPMIELLKEILARLYDVRGMIEWGGTLLVCIIVFVETGMFVGFFLPGDSLLVTAGVFAGAGQLRLAWLLSLVTLCAIAGDQIGYLIGWKAGAGLYNRKDSRFFKRRHLERAHEFYERYGGKTVILARFVPIIRTFCPPVAGAAKMRYGRYLLYDICGGFCWVWGMVLLGYTLGRTVPNIDKRIHYIIAAVIILSFVPAVYHAWKAREHNPTPAIERSNPGKD